MNKHFLLETVPFKNFTDNELDDALILLNAKIKKYRKKEVILHSGDKTDNLGIVLNGQITIENTDFWGNQLILAKNQSGAVFAETYAYLENHPLMVDVIAAEVSEILFLNLNKIKTGELEHKPWFLKLFRNLLTASAQKNLLLSNRSFHTSSKSAKVRIASYLSYQAVLQQRYEFDIPFNRQEMADYLNLDRSALSKELGKMRDEGMITFRKNHFILNAKEFDS